MTPIIQDLSSDTSDEFEDVNVSYIGRRKYIHVLVFENIQVIKCTSVPPDIDDTVVYEVPIGSENIQVIKWTLVSPDIDDTVVYEVPIGSSGKLTHCKGLRP